MIPIPVLDILGWGSKNWIVRTLCSDSFTLQWRHPHSLAKCSGHQSRLRAAGGFSSRGVPAAHREDLYWIPSSWLGQGATRGWQHCLFLILFLPLEEIEILRTCKKTYVNLLEVKTNEIYVCQANSFFAIIKFFSP